jgi:hypothetical protein
MDARYNDFIDNGKWRIVLNVTGFALWLAAAVGLIAVGLRF